MQRTVNWLRLTIAALNVGVWLPWFAYAISALGYVPPQRSVVDLGLPLLGLALAVICIRARLQWEFRALVPLLPLLIWAVFLYLEVLARPVHQETGCAVCSLVHIRTFAAALSFERNSYLLAFNVLWWDFLLPFSVFGTTLLLGFINLRRVISGPFEGKANAT